MDGGHALSLRVEGHLGHARHLGQQRVLINAEPQTEVYERRLRWVADGGHGIILAADDGIVAKHGDGDKLMRILGGL